MRKITFGIIHCAATPPGMDIGAVEIRRWHVEDNGWADIGYHYVIRRSGAVEFGRDTDQDGDIWEEIGAHVAGHNADSLGICLVGGKDSRATDRFEQHFTHQQHLALSALMHGIQGALPGIRWMGHNQLAAKACPGFQVDAAFLKEMGL